MLVLRCVKLWPNGVVPYEISEDFNEHSNNNGKSYKDVILDAMREIENKTKIDNEQIIR